MKRINILIFVAIATLINWSCEEKENMDPVGNWELSTPTLSTPAEDASFTLDENTPDAEVRFEWTPATTTNRFGVAYTLMLVPAGSDDFADPILEITPGNAGRESFITVTAEEIDYALWAACYPAGATVDLQWVVVAKAIEKKTMAAQNLTVKRFETEYTPSTLFVYGSGAEAGPNVASATPMRRLPDGEGNPTNVFEVYTTLTAGGTFTFRDKPVMTSRSYGGADGTLEPCASEITAPETGQYRITVDLDNNTYELLHIERWSLVGDAVEGGWGGDVPLSYAGNGIWKGDVEFLSESGFVFRANGDWSYLLKRIQGTGSGNNKAGDLVMESYGNANGILFEDIPGTLGPHTVTLNLGADGYDYSLVEIKQEGPVAAVIGESNNLDADAVSGNFPVADMATPDAVFLLSDGEVVAEFTKDGDVFSSGKFLALEESKTYTLNTANDGSGDEIVDGDISVARDQAYTLKVDFATGKLTWKYYNMKLFHWDEAGGGWDARDEFVMTYVHPYTFEVTANLVGGYDVKFNSPWEVQFGTAATSLTGTMENVDGGPNFKGITQSGTYVARIVVAEDFMTADYSFEKQ